MKNFFGQASWYAGLVAIVAMSMAVDYLEIIPKTAIPITTIPIVIFAIICHACSKEKPKALPPLAYGLVAIGMGLVSYLYYQQNVRIGGDIDPIAFLREKTRERGGYFLLTSKTDYKEKRVSKDTFLDSPFSSYKFSKGVPSITELADHPIQVDFPHGAHHVHVTITLHHAVVYLPFNEKKVGLFFDHNYGHDEAIVDPEYLIANELEKLGQQTFQSFTYPPSEGWFDIQLNETDHLLHDLEQYGFTIVPHSNKKPTLRFTIEYTDPFGTELVEKRIHPPEQPEPQAMAKK